MRKLALIIVAAAALLIPAVASANYYDESGGTPYLGDCDANHYGEWGYTIDNNGGGHGWVCWDTQYLDGGWPGDYRWFNIYFVLPAFGLWRIRRPLRCRR